MNEICRLCLSVTTEMQDLFENSNITLKIKSGLQLQIRHEDCLPDRICQHCVDRIYSIDNFLLSVQENQSLLYSRLSLGIDHLENFYSLLKNVKEENKDILKTEVNKDRSDLNIKESTENIQNELYNGIYFKQEKEENYYSSDDDTALIALKETKEQISNNVKQNIKKKHKVKTKKPKKSLQETKSQKTLIRSSEYNLKLEEYKCCTCFEVVDSYDGLYQHYRDKHKPINLPKIDKNNFTFTEVDGNKFFKCNLCVKTYNNKKQVQAHIELAHQDDRPYICNECGRTYKLIRLIILHSRAHRGVKYFCTYNCGYGSVYPANIKVHEMRHRKEYRYKCEKCEKGFESRNQYNEHQNFHNGVKPFVCSICGHAFVHSHHMDSHKKEVHPEAYLEAPSKGEARLTCIHCSKPFAYKMQLRNHLETEHGLQQKFLCDVCGKAFKRRTGLANHKKFHVKKITCSTCNKAFSTNSHLKRHNLTAHIGYKKHECPKCGKTFRDKICLNRHESSIHSTDKRNRNK